METYFTETGIIKEIHDLFPYLQYIVKNLIDGNLQDLADKGYAEIAVLQAIISAERNYHYEQDSTHENQTPGLYWLKVPPDHATEEALAKAHCTNFDTSSDFYIQRCQPLMSQGPEYGFDFSLKDILDGQTPLATSEWNIELPMWDQEGETQLTLRLKARIKSGNPSFFITDLEIM